MMSHTDHEGKTFRSFNAMCIYWGMDRYTVINRLKKGLSLKEALTKPVKALSDCMPRDHLGNTFSSFGAMCKAYQKSQSLVYYREQVKHWDRQKALTTPTRAQVQKEKLDRYNVPANLPLSVIHNRLRAGWTEEQAYTSRLGAKNPQKRKTYPVKKVKDHTGQEYASLAVMASAWGVDASVVYGRLRLGWSVEQALTATKKSKISIKNGRQKYGDKVSDTITDRTIARRLKAGWSEERAYCEPAHYGEATDHLGNIYPSTGAMCAHYGIGYRTLHNRLRHGLSLKAALTSTTELKATRCKEVKDHLGTTYKSLSDMCAEWDIVLSTFQSRIKQGWTLARALTAPKRIQGPFMVKGEQYQTWANLITAYPMVDEDDLRVILAKGYTADEAIDLLLKEGNNEQ